VATICSRAVTVCQTLDMPGSQQCASETEGSHMLLTDTSVTVCMPSAGQMGTVVDE